MKGRPVQCHILSFEGPDPYARAGGLASRIAGLSSALVEAGFETHLWFVGDPDLPSYEDREGLGLHRWCQWISRYHPQGVYDGEEGKRADYAASLPPFLSHQVLFPSLQRTGSALIIAEEWHTVDAVLHLDWLLQTNRFRQQVTILWNVNNTFGFNRIDWNRLRRAAIVTTVSRYMKALLQRFDIDAIVISNGLPKEAYLLPEEEAVKAFRDRLAERTVITKVARWDPAKRWLPSVETVRTMKAQAWRPLLIARGGAEGYGKDVLNRAAAQGLRVTEKALASPSVRDLLEALEGLRDIDVISLLSPLQPTVRGLLFHGSDAVLANSRHEPFGLVGLETMAVAGVACVGNTGEDYTVPGYNALVSETDDPQHFVNLFRVLKGAPFRERALRRAGRRTAQEYRWSKIIQRNLLPRLSL